MESIKVCLLPSALTYYERPFTGQNAAVYTITSNLLPFSFASELAGLIARKDTSSSKYTNKKIIDIFARILPSHIIAAFPKWALVTKDKMASPLDHDPKFLRYWSEHPRDKMFGANTNAFSSRFSEFSICHSIHHENTMLLAT